MIVSAWARETATFKRFIEKRNSMLRGISSALEVAIDTMHIGASCPWNLSTVPTRVPGGSVRVSKLSWAL